MQTHERLPLVWTIHQSKGEQCRIDDSQDLSRTNRHCRSCDDCTRLSIPKTTQDKKRYNLRQRCA